MTKPSAFVFVIDDDPSIRRAIHRLLGSVGLEAGLFGSTGEFLRSPRADVPSCMILDVRLPGISGLDFQRELAVAQIHIPIVFITSHGDIPMSVQAMKMGAVNFLLKPFRDQDLLDSVQQALEQDKARRQQQTDRAVLQARLASLTPRERELLPLVISGLLNREIAEVIGTSETTVKVHRSHLIRKTGAHSFAELVRIADKLKIEINGSKGELL